MKIFGSSSTKLDTDLLAEMEEEQARLIEEQYQKARDDMTYIEENRHLVKDKGLAEQLSRMQKISGNMLKYLRKNPRKIPQAQKFIDYYQDRAVLLVQKYREFEEANLESTEFEAMKDRLRRSLGELEAAYADQFKKLLHEQFTDLEAEMEVIHRSLDMDGIKGRANVSLPPEDDFNLPVPKPASLDWDDIERQERLPRPGKTRRNRQITTVIPGRSDIIPDDVRGDVIITKLIQSALAIFLGGFGAHKFYQGKTGQGILYCLLCWTGLPEFIGFCEGIRYLVMKLDNFYLDYYLERK